MRDPKVQKIFNSKEWKKFRAWKLLQNPLCEMCEKEGFYTIAKDVHHIKPIAEGKSDMEMKMLAFNPANVMALCVPCHIKIHKQDKTGGRGGKEAHQQRAQERLQRFMDKYTKHH